MGDHIILVTTSEDGVKGSLREAIQEANQRQNTTIIIKPSVGKKIILCEGELTVTSNVRLISEVGRDLTITSKNSRIFNVRASIDPLPFFPNTFEISSPCDHIILKGGQTEESGGAISVSFPRNHLFLENVIIKKNSAGVNGGGIYTQGRLTMKRSLVIKNTAGKQGGGIWAALSVRLTDAKVIGNETGDTEGNGGGGVFIDLGHAYLNRSSIAHNKSPSGNGGGIVIMVGSLFLENQSHVDCNLAFNVGGVQVGLGNVHVLDHSTINQNESTNDQTGSAGGGGVAISLGSTYLVDSEICGNQTVGMFSGGIVILVGDVQATNSTISGNTNHGPGGGIAMNFGNVIIEKSTISKNVGASLGGGIVSFTPYPGVIKIDQSTISENTLTNQQTIIQTIIAFLSVILGYLDTVTQQSSGPGGEEFISNIPNIKEKLKLIAEELAKIIIFPNTIGGGGVAALLSTEITATQSTIKDNFAGKNVNPKNVPFTALGGGLFGFNASLTIEESVIVKNEVKGRGGGIYNGNLLVLDSSKIIRNRARNGGGVFSTQPFTAMETIIKRNKPNDVVVE